MSVIINPNLHNPKIDGVDLLVNGMLNKDIGLSYGYLVDGDGVTIERDSNGYITISLKDFDDSYLEFYSKRRDIDFLQIMPSTAYYKVYVKVGGKLDDVFLTSISGNIKDPSLHIQTRVKNMECYYV